MDDDATDADDLSPLAGWLAPRLEVDEVTIGAFDRPSGGYSAETLILPITTRSGGATAERTIVFRRENPEEPVYPKQAPGLDVEIDVQYRVMEAVRDHTAAPVATLYGYEADTAVLGDPFFVMDFVPGDVPREDPIYTSAGFFVDATPAQRRTLVLRGIETLAEVNRIDVDEAELGWLTAEATPGAERQLDVWEHHTRVELRGRKHPLFERSIDYLRSSLPAEGPVTLNWGDGRPGNIIWQDFEPVCVMDFEAAAIGPAELDLGWWLMFDRWSHENMGHPRLEGEPSLAEQRDHYEEALGRDLAPITWFEIYAAMKYTGIVVRVMNRLEERGLMPPDHDVWLNNPATTCLDAMMAELD